MILKKNIFFSIAIIFSLLCARQPGDFNVVVKDIKTAEKTIRISPFQGIGTITVNLCFKNAGQKLSPRHKEALVSLLARALGEATDTKTREQLQDYARQHNVSVSGSANDDDFVIVGRCPSHKLPELTSLLKELLLHSKFNGNDLKRFKSEIEATVLQSLQMPEAQLGELIKKNVLSDHPYGTLQATYLNSLKNIEVNDLKSFMKNYFAQGNLIISACGEINEEMLIKQISEVIESLPKTNKICLPENRKVAGPYKIYTQEFPVPQTIIRMIHDGIDTNHPDFFALQIAIGCIGSPGIGILWKKIREEKGLTYGIGAGLAQQDHFNIFCIQTSTQTKTVDQTIQAIREELANTYQNGIPEDLIETVKKSFLGNYKRSFSSTQHIAARLTKYQRDERPVDFHNLLIEKISALTPDEVNSAFKRFLKLDQFMIFMVGK